MTFEQFIVFDLRRQLLRQCNRENTPKEAERLSYFEVANRTRVGPLDMDLRNLLDDIVDPDE
jgi:hypothetical protein